MPAKIEQRHREAAYRIFFSEPARPGINSLAWIETGLGAPGSHAGPMTRAAQALADAEQPAPSAPAEFDPWEALAERWAQLQHNVSFHQRDAVIPKSVWAAGKHGAGRTFREAALDLCRKLGLTESPKGKEGANG